jgi:trans-2,3-dihydro-3-hydroxyanthranilate isomerase
MTHYRVYDVFTETAFGGNQLAVFPDATRLSAGSLQKIAREFNFSETTFVYPPEDPAHTAKVRIFTPMREIQFAGHPTVGTAVALSNLGHTGPMTLELGIGPIPCEVSGNTASFTTSAPLTIIAKPEIALVAAAIGVSVDAISTTVHAPTQASLGLEFVFVELTSRETLSACQPDIDAFRVGSKRYPAGLDFAIFAYVRDNNHLDARMFAPLDAMPEDPATGSACATITALLSQIAGEPLTFDIHQGDDMGRPSRILAQAFPGDPNPIKITGSAVLTMKGTFVG